MFSPKILEQIDKLIRENSNTLLIVEGKKDKKALNSIGFFNIVDISGDLLEDVVEKVVSLRERQVTILTDFDEEGENISSHLNNLFTFHHVPIDKSIRNKFRSFNIHQIEELDPITELMEDGYNGKTGSIYNKIFNRSRVLGRRNCRKT